jgi:hypothetical protein
MVQRGFKLPQLAPVETEKTMDSSMRAETTNTAIIEKEETRLKIKQSNDSRAKRNLTLMIISVSLLFSFGTLPWAVYYTMVNVIKLNFVFLGTLQIVARCCLYSLIACKIFIYYFFNRLYRQVLKQYLKMICFFVYK